VVTEVNYFGIGQDQEALLEHLGGPTSVTLHPWPVVRSPLEVLLLSDALPFLNSVYALPGALIALQNGAVGRD